MRPNIGTCVQMGAARLCPAHLSTGGIMESVPSFLITPTSAQASTLPSPSRFHCCTRLFCTREGRAWEAVGFVSQGDPTQTQADHMQTPGNHRTSHTALPRSAFCGSHKAWKRSLCLGNPAQSPWLWHWCGSYVWEGRRPYLQCRQLQESHFVKHPTAE